MESQVQRFEKADAVRAAEAKNAALQLEIESLKEDIETLMDAADTRDYDDVQFEDNH